MAYERAKQGQIFSSKPVSVSDYISILNQLISRVNLKVIGEVSGVKMASSGHVYFSLKDSKTGDIINCAIWRSIYNMCGIKIEEGMEVVLSGSADIYKPRGTLTFKVKTIELVGEGALRKAYEELKKKLEKKGLFDEQRKRKIPYYPHRIGVITSKKGAAIHDFINNLGKFGFKVLVCDSRVEGQEAVEDLIKSIKIMKKKSLDVLVIVRGGGSLQSLMAFDNEMLVTEIAKFPVPVITGIGHHEDIPLASLASDAFESTPTAAAHRLSCGFQEAKEKNRKYEKIIFENYRDIFREKIEKFTLKEEIIKNFFKNIFEEYRRSEEKIKKSINLATYFVKEGEKRINRDAKNIFSFFSRGVRENENKIKRVSNIIYLNNPQKQLRLGYAIIKKDKKIVKSIEEIKEGDTIRATLFDGEVNSQIKNIKEKKHDKRKQ